MQEKKELGDWGEQLVIDRLTSEGWQIREHQWRFQHFEIGRRQTWWLPQGHTSLLANAIFRFSSM